MWVHAVKDYCTALRLASNGSVRVSVDDPSEGFVVGVLGDAGWRQAPKVEELGGAPRRGGTPEVSCTPSDGGAPWRSRGGEGVAEEGGSRVGHGVLDEDERFWCAGAGECTHEAYV